MKYLSVSEIAKKWSISERSVRNYCSEGRVSGAYLVGKTWSIPEDAHRPERANQSPRTLLDVLRDEKKNAVRGGIYHKVQIELTYNSNRIEGSRLTHDQTRYIYETNTVGAEGGEPINVDDIVETANHFRAIDSIIDTAEARLSEAYIKRLHEIIKRTTKDSTRPWFAVGDYKRLPNEVGGRATTLPEDVPSVMRALISEYEASESKSLDELIDFHYRFESIHPFQDGNGRVGRLLLFKECLKNGIVPFIISDDLKMYYYRGLAEWSRERGYLRDTCLSAQDTFKRYLDYFKIPYSK